MIVDREGLYTFLMDFWGAMVKEPIVSWSVHVSTTANVAHVPIDADMSPSELTFVLAQMLTLVEAEMVAFTSYAGDVARSSWCAFDPKRDVLLAKADVPGLVLPTLTNLREGWGELYARSKAHKSQSYTMMNHALQKASGARARIAKAMGDPRECRSAEVQKGPALRAGGLLVRITRFGKKLLDHDDNLPTSCKHVRDGVAKALGYDDGDLGISWHYDQHLCDKNESPGVRLELFERDRCNVCNQYTVKRERPF